jgi:hypothetical protein
MGIQKYHVHTILINMHDMQLSSTKHETVMPAEVQVPAMSIYCCLIWPICNL